MSRDDSTHYEPMTDDEVKAERKNVRRSTTTGAAIGNAVGTVIPVPVLGNVIGATIGATIGFIVGRLKRRSARKKLPMTPENAGKLARASMFSGGMVAWTDETALRLLTELGQCVELYDTPRDWIGSGRWHQWGWRSYTGLPPSLGMTELAALSVVDLVLRYSSRDSWAEWAVSPKSEYRT